MNIVLIAHVVAAILLIGPVTVSTSMFPRVALAAHNGDADSRGSAKTLFRITRLYGLISLLVPVLGVAVMFSDMPLYIRNGIVHGSILLAVIAWVLLLFVIVPKQRAMIVGLGIQINDDEENDPKDVEKAAGLNWNKAKSQLAMFSGIWALLWVILAILMFFI